MSTHSYSRLWIHLIWETLDREPMLDQADFMLSPAPQATYFVSFRVISWIVFLVGSKTNYELTRKPLTLNRDNAIMVEGLSMEHFDVMIVGAGLSGVGAACHLRQRHNQQSP